MLFVLISTYFFQTPWILLIWTHVVPSVRSLNSYLSQTGQAGILVLEGIYLNLLMDQFFYPYLLPHPKDKGINLIFVKQKVGFEDCINQYVSTDSQNLFCEGNNIFYTCIIQIVIFLVHVKQIIILHSQHRYDLVEKIIKKYLGILSKL